VHLPSCSWFVVAAVQKAGVARKRVTAHVAMALASDVVVRTSIFVVVARTIG